MDKLGLNTILLVRIQFKAADGSLVDPSYCDEACLAVRGHFTRATV
jgi:hypothetical protein